jgi:glycosyltransferase involved in cell wall biosynthesis
MGSHFTEWDLCVLVSVIIPAYNQARFLESSLQSVFTQSYSNLEIIVVDDGSTDETSVVADRHVERIRYIRQDNQGLAGARNTGIRAANGEFIGLLDADDQWLPSYLETMVSVATSHPEAAVYYCNARAMDVNGHNLPQLLGGPVRPPGTMRDSLLRANFLIPSTILARRPILLEAGLFDQSLRSCEDWDLWLRLLPRYDFMGTSACLVRYRVHGSSLSTNPTGMQKAAQAVVEKHFGPDDGQLTTWTKEKRRAYGGLYRYYALTSVQRKNDWKTAGQYLEQALSSDPTLSIDLDLFYNFALGTQPQGYRGTAVYLDIVGNAQKVNSMLAQVFGLNTPAQLAAIKRQTIGTANFAIGLVAYNTDQRLFSRRMLWCALRSQPELLIKRQFARTLVRSLLPGRMLTTLKSLKSRLWSNGHNGGAAA